jgi:hypothetical protein
VAGVLLVLATLAVALSAPRLFGGGAVEHRGPLARHVVSTRLPPAADGPVSRILGRDDPAYRAAPTLGGLGVRNPRQGMGAWFDRRGVVIRSGGAWLGLRLTGYGYGRSLRAAGAVAPVAEANRVAYRRGGLVEWYANGPLGLEQGFDLAARPAGGHGGPLTLSLAISGNVRDVLSRGAEAVIFTRRAVSLAYRGLVVSDARGRVLPARIELRAGRLLLRIDDRRARYPLRIDPFIQQAKLTASDGTVGDALGPSVAVSGDTVVVGAPHATVNNHPLQGAVYVFVMPAGGWASETQAAKLTASDGAGSNTLGSSVAISGDTVVAGAANSLPDGAAYVFVMPAGGWASETQAAKLTASGSNTNEELGYSVAVSGDTVVAGAVNSHSGGAAYVFVKPAGGWASETDQAKLTASDGANGDEFGGSVAVSGDTVVAGAPGTPINGTSPGGAAYVFVKPTGGWASETEQAKLTASDGAGGDEFGGSVAVSGDTVVAGDPEATVNNHAGQGAAYVFVMPAGGWASETEQAKLTASDGLPGDQFGHSVAISGDTVVAGAPVATVKGNSEQGAAYVFVMPAGGWASKTEQAKLTASDGAAGDQLGFSVGVSGDAVVAGAPIASVNGHAGQGAAYVFVDLDPTTTRVSCGKLKGKTTCTATVTDTSSGSPTAPTGTVTFAGSGTSFTPDPCTLTSVSGTQASCTVSASKLKKKETVTATYSGDATHATSSGTTIGS